MAKNNQQLTPYDDAIVAEPMPKPKSDNPFDQGESSTYKLDFHGIVAGTFDFLGLEELIDLRIGKVGSHVKLNTGATIKAMCLQLLSAPYQTLYGTSGYFTNLPLCSLLNKPVMAEALDRNMLSRTLDTIAEYGPKKLFMECAALAAHRLGLNISEVHIDSTSFHCDCDEKGGDDLCELRIEYGYSRDHRPDLPQVILLGLVDGHSKLPIYANSISGGVNDNKSFFDLVKHDWPELARQFKDLRYLVGDSALCTSDILKQAREHELQIVTRAPDKLKITKECFAMAEEGELVPFDPDEPDGSYGMWCGTKKIGDVPVKLLLVNNERMRYTKEKTLRRRAEKELDKLTKELNKLRTNPAICQADAEKQFKAIQAKCKLCSIGEPVYEEVKKHKKRGRPSKQTEPEVAAVKVLAEARIDEDKLSNAVTRELRYVLATTDTKRHWTMEELCAIYHGQSSIERMWRTSKDPTILLNAIYLKKPSRISALMWLLSIALLVFSATEYKFRQTTRELGITELNELKDSIQLPAHLARLAAKHRSSRVPAVRNQAVAVRSTKGKTDYSKRVTLHRFKKYVQNINISIMVLGKYAKVSGMTRNFVDIVHAMGPEWEFYFCDETYSYANVSKLYGGLDDNIDWTYIGFNRQEQPGD